MEELIVPVDAAATGAEGDNESEQTIVVTGHRIRSDGGSGGSISLSSPIVIDTSGTFDFPSDMLPSALRNLPGLGTNFDIDEKLSPEVKALIIRAIQELAQHPDYANLFDDLLNLNVDINIQAWDPRLPPEDAVSMTIGRNDDGTVSAGSTLNIYQIGLRGRSTYYGRTGCCDYT